MKKISVSALYLYVGLTIGLLFVFLIPPFQSPDEDSHFKKSYQISRGHLYGTSEDGKIGNTFPVEMIEYIREKLSMIGDRDQKYKYSELIADQYSTMDYHHTSFHNYSTVDVMPVTYFVPAFGIIIGKGFARILGRSSVSTVYMLYFARLFSFLFHLFLIYMAIKITPIMKKTMFFIALLPMTFYLCCCVSYDGLLISLSLLGVSMILDLIYMRNSKMTKFKLFVFGFIGLVLLNIKILYFPLLFLMAFIPENKFFNGTKKDKIRILCLLFVAVFIISLLLKIPNFLMASSVSNEDLSKQVLFVIKHPFKFLYYVFWNLYDRREWFFHSTVGMLGLLDTFMPFGVLFLFAIYGVVFPLLDAFNSKYHLTKLPRILLGLYTLCAIIMIFGALYVTWTPGETGKIGDRLITGVQGRYFIPLLFPISLLFTSSYFYKKKSKKIEFILDQYFVFPIFGLILSFFLVLLRYYF